MEQQERRILHTMYQSTLQCKRLKVSVLLEKFLTLLVQFILSLFLFLKTQNKLLARGITQQLQEHVGFQFIKATIGKLLIFDQRLTSPANHIELRETVPAY